MKGVREMATAMVFLLVVTFVSAMSAPQVHAQRLGRLFTTPEQRSVLNEIRTQAQFAEPELEPEPEPQTSNVTVTEQESTGPSIANLTINGVVRRRGGRTTVWVNGREIDRGDVTREGVLVESVTRRSGDVRLRLPSGTETIALRPGQKIDIGTGTVLEPYEQSPSATTQGAFPKQRSAFPVASGSPVGTGRNAETASNAQSSLPRAFASDGGSAVRPETSVVEQLRAILNSQQAQQEGQQTPTAGQRAN
jgi:hypothetical protein